MDLTSKYTIFIYGLYTTSEIQGYSKNIGGCSPRFGQITMLCLLLFSFFLHKQFNTQLKSTKALKRYAEEQVNWHKELSHCIFIFHVCTKQVHITNWLVSMFMKIARSFITPVLLDYENIMFSYFILLKLSLSNN